MEYDFTLSTSSSSCVKSVLPTSLIQNHLCLCLPAAGLAVGLGIGAIAEMAKQSLGGKQNEGKAILLSFAFLLPSCEKAFGPVHTWQIQHTHGQLVGPGEVSNVLAPARHWTGIKSKLLTRT